MKKVLCIFIAIVFIPAAAGAIVFDRQENRVENIVPGITVFDLNSASVRVNGKDVEIKRYESREPVKKVLDAYLEKAEKQGSRLVNNQFLWLAASTLFKAAGSGAETGSFGYIFMIDRKDTATFVIAGSHGNNTEIIKSEIRDYSGKTKGGYNDGLSHFLGAEKVLSIELLSGGRTINFGNFYRIPGSGRLETRNYYSGEFRKKGFAVLKKEYTEDADHYMLKRKKQELVVNISPQENGEIIVFVMGLGGNYND
jgi:hypothetical protein